MRISTLKHAFFLFALCSAAAAAQAGSSATAITTITANIVPAASFSAAEPVILTRSFGSTDHKAATTNQSGHVTLSSAEPTKLHIKSSQNLIYDLSIPASVSVPGIVHEVSTRFDKTRPQPSQGKTGNPVLMDITGAVNPARTQEPGDYKGLIDITVNYN